MNWPLAIVALVAAQRLAELAWARRNQKRLLAQGAVEAGRRHYPLLVAFHAAWLVALALLVPADASISMFWLAVFGVLQGLRLWVIASLGPYWTTRIISLPGAPLRRRGPYRLLRHPNYAVVAAEVPVLPLAFGAWGLALVFGLAHLPLLAWRIRVEEAALTPRRGLPPASDPPFKDSRSGRR